MTVIFPNGNRLVFNQAGATISTVAPGYLLGDQHFDQAKHKGNGK